MWTSRPSNESTSPAASFATNQATTLMQCCVADPYLVEPQFEIIPLVNMRSLPLAEPLRVASNPSSETFNCPEV